QPRPAEPEDRVLHSWCPHGSLEPLNDSVLYPLHFLPLLVRRAIGDPTNTGEGLRLSPAGPHEIEHLAFRAGEPGDRRHQPRVVERREIVLVRGTVPIVRGKFDRILAVPVVVVA